MNAFDFILDTYLSNAKVILRSRYWQKHSNFGFTYSLGKSRVIKNTQRCYENQIGLQSEILNKIKRVLVIKIVTALANPVALGTR